MPRAAPLYIAIEPGPSSDDVSHQKTPPCFRPKPQLIVVGRRALAPSMDNDSTFELTNEIAGTSLAGCTLVVMEGDERDQSRTLKLEAGMAKIGSSEDCDLVLHDDSISRSHVRITVHRDGIEVEDLGSTNGTFHMDNRIQKLTLHAGGRLKLGRTLIDIVPLPQSTLNPPYLKDHYGALVGAGPKMRHLFSQMTLLEKTEAPVLVLGETGTGKELIAQALHDHSVRADKPYIVVDCANLSGELIGSELFGHTKGAFTGATAERRGAFEEAEGGTIFLDEIGELPIELQRTLLRVLETGQIKKLGQSSHRKVNVRVVAATHRDLAQCVEEGTFREDLYFRLSVFALNVPALRERREDLDLLIDTLRQRMGLDEKALPSEIRGAMQRHSWPGNIRELRNALQRVHVFGDLPLSKAKPSSGGPLADLQIDTTGEFNVEKGRVLVAFEAAYLKDLMARTKNISDAARDAGISRKQMRDMLKRHKLYE